MIYCAYTLACLLFAVFQSTALPALLPSYFTYDLMLPLVLYLALFHPSVGTFLFLFIPGLMMDAVTGGPLGVYVLAYCWLFAGIRAAVHLVERDSLMVMITAVAVGVVLEHALFWLTGILSGSGPFYGFSSIGVVAGRIVTAALTGPLLMLLLRRAVAYMAPERKQFPARTDVSQEAGWHHI